MISYRGVVDAALTRNDRKAKNLFASCILLECRKEVHDV
jgi:hypothetical protein